jgi:hypothetical protein
MAFHTVTLMPIAGTFHTGSATVTVNSMNASLAVHAATIVRVKTVDAVAIARIVCPNTIGVI